MIPSTSGIAVEAIPIFSGFFRFVRVSSGRSVLAATACAMASAALVSRRDVDAFPLRCFRDVATELLDELGELHITDLRWRGSNDWPRRRCGARLVVWSERN